MKRAEIDRLRGLCSGIPICCIDYFINTWSKIWVTHEGHVRRARLYNSHFNYIPCDACAKHPARKVWVRKCRAGCMCEMRLSWLKKHGAL